MVRGHVERLSNKNHRYIKEVASQIAGRKQRRKTAFNFRVPPHMQRRSRQSPFKDIAHSTKNELLHWIEEDGHGPSAEGGSISDALRHTVSTLHHVYSRDLKEHRRGGSITGLVGDAAHYLKRSHEVLENVAGTTLTHGEILADNALDALGIRKSRYGALERNEQNQLHARLSKEAYKSHGSRGTVDGWEYHSGTDKYGVWGKGNQRIVHWRGTRPDANVVASGDLSADAKIALGESDSMYGLDDDKRVVTDLLDAGYDTSISGYSLGGGRALAVANDDEIYKRLGTNNHVISPGITHMNPHLKKLANLDKFSYTYSAHDGVANALLPHANDNHHVEKKYRDGISAHTDFLSYLSN